MFEQIERAKKTLAYEENNTIFLDKEVNQLTFEISSYFANWPMPTMFYPTQKIYTNHSWMVYQMLIKKIFGNCYQVFAREMQLNHF